MNERLALRMNEIQFRKIINTLKVNDMTLKKNIIAFTKDMRDGLTGYIETAEKIITQPDCVKFTTQGAPYTSGMLKMPKSEQDRAHPMLNFIIYYDEDLYGLSAIVPSQSGIENKTMDLMTIGTDETINMTARTAVMEAAVQAQRPDCFKKKNKPKAGPPLYARRAMDLYFSGHKIARTNENHQAIWEHIRLTDARIKPTTWNFMAFTNAAMGEENQFSQAMAGAVEQCMTCNLIKCGHDPMNDACTEPDFFADPNSSWPKSKFEN